MATSRRSRSPEKRRPAMGNSAVRRHFEDGDIIIRQDTVGDEMFIIESGEARIYREIRGVETSLDEIREGESFGEMALFDNRPRSASARAVGPTELRVISREEFANMKCDPVIRDVMRHLSHRLRAVDDAFEQLSLQEAPEREALAQLWEQRDWTV
jgi:CRP-like cAMP-binding protein